MASEAADTQRGLGRRGLVYAVGLFAVAALLRVVYVLSVADDPSVQYPMVDSRAYHERAAQILAGQWNAERVAYQDPLYPYFLALLYAVFGAGSKGVLVAQALLDAGTVLFVYGIARRLFGEPVAVTAGAIAALYKVFFFFDAFLLKLPLSVFLLTAAVYALVCADQTGRRRTWFAAGAALALACLTRGNYLVLVPIAGLFALVEGQRLRIARAVAYAAGVLVVVIPVASYNYVVADDFVLVTSQAGQNFYVGNHRENDTGGYKAPPFVRANPTYEEIDFRREAERRSGRAMKPSELSRFWFGEALAEIRADPMHFLRHLATKARVYASDYEVPDNQSYDYFESEVSALLKLPLPTWGVVLPVALCGMALALRQRTAWLLISFIAAYSASVILFFNMARYRVPVVPLLAVFAGLALVSMVGWARTRRLRPLLAGAVFIAVALPLFHANVPEPDFAVTHYNLGIRHLGAAEIRRTKLPPLMAAGETERVEALRAEVLFFMELAQGELARALEIQPSTPKVRNQLARLMVTIALEREARGDLAGALAQARETTARFPRFADAFVQQGRLEASAGEPARARAALERAIALAPGHPLAMAELEKLDAAESATP